jgi:hypothetical protein
MINQTKNNLTKMKNMQHIKLTLNQKSKRSFTFTLRLVAILNNVLNVGLLRPFSMRIRLEVSKPQSEATSNKVRNCCSLRLRMFWPSFVRYSNSVIENSMINYAALFRIWVYQF